MIPAFFNDPLYSAWPFWVLELTPAASLQEVERAARELSAKLKLGLPAAASYRIPGQMLTRDEYLVREARAKLITPESRLICEFWYVAPDLVETREAAPSLTVDDWQKLLGNS